MGRPPGGGVSRPAFLAAPPARVVAVDNLAGKDGAVGLQELPGHEQTEPVQPGERGQIRGRKSRVSRVEVFRSDRPNLVDGPLAHNPPVAVTALPS